jgi:hypothetical protein
LPHERLLHHHFTFSIRTDIPTASDRSKIIIYHPASTLRALFDECQRDPVCPPADMGSRATSTTVAQMDNSAAEHALETVRWVGRRWRACCDRDQCSVREAQRTRPATLHAPRSQSHRRTSNEPAPRNPAPESLCHSSGSSRSSLWVHQEVCGHLLVQPRVSLPPALASSRPPGTLIL